VDVGLRSEAAILARLVEGGYQVLLPFGVNQRFDLVIKRGSRFLTAQCKTGRLRNGVVEFSARSVQSNRKGTRFRGYVGEVDLFIVYCPGNRGIYVIPAAEVPATGMYLRVDPPLNGQDKRVRWARDYELPA
jgi:hypothetical protein